MASPSDAFRCHDLLFGFDATGKIIGVAPGGLTGD
jgi:hypothetical protein